ncbi:MAG: transpeptidase family protein [Deltaproteobacteria bacterium]|nr:transpeptidase family protein [Deltaproteobacteria bacterium]MCL4873294.1 transpeptidase family protein [bacterium]
MRRRKQAKKGDAYLKLRLYVILGLFLAAFGAIVFRAVQLQIVKGPELKKMAERQHRKTLNLQSKRGDIYDRNLKELAVSIDVDSVFAQPDKIESPRATARALAPVIGVSSFELEKKLSGDGRFVWLKRQVDLKGEDRDMIRGLEGIGIIKEGRRFYPNRQLASNLIGFTGLDASGLEGVEKYYDTMLKGSSARLTGERDAMGRGLLYKDLDKTVPLQGMEVELTIDKSIQYIAEKSLKKAVDEYDAKGGTAIVMDPMTGEILAMATQPSFDPNDIRRYGSGSWRNRAIADVFEPGSTFKLFLIAAALEENIVKPENRFYCENGKYRVADRVFHDTKEYGWLTVTEILKYSSNIGTAKIGEKLGSEQIYRYLKAFGFGARNGIDLPGEATGVLRHPKNWSKVSLHTISFGQGVSVTGLQMITALSSIANGGFLMQPYVVKSVKEPGGRPVAETHPVVVKRVISEDTARKLTNMMVEATGKKSTGELAALPDFEVAGKTGTAQKPDFKNGGYARGAYIASFMGFVPADDPMLAILVTVDEPRGEYYGGRVAGPVFREIAEESLAYLGVFREGPGAMRVERALMHEDAAPVDGDAEEPSGIRPMAVPDFKGKSVRMVMRMSSERSFDVEIRGSGRAVSQSPTPGSSIPSKGPVIVEFR